MYAEKRQVTEDSIYHNMGTLETLLKWVNVMCWKVMTSFFSISECFYEFHMEEYMGHCNYYTYTYKPEYSVDTFLQINLEQYYYNFSPFNFFKTEVIASCYFYLHHGTKWSPYSFTMLFSSPPRHFNISIAF